MAGIVKIADDKGQGKGQCHDDDKAKDNPFQVHVPPRFFLVVPTRIRRLNFHVTRHQSGRFICRGLYHDI
jgi:hypothetical protein